MAMPLPTSLVGVTVQIVFSGGLDMDEKNLYASVLAPFALGIPSGQVQLYCSNHFLDLIPEHWVNTVRVINSRISATVLPGYGNYFAEIHGRATNAAAPLPDCSLRFICGHGYGGASGHVSVWCGDDKMHVKDFATHASVLTVLDICNAPNAVHGIKAGPGAMTPAEDGDFNKKGVFNNLAFPLVSTKSSVTHCFRVSWNGHQAVSERDPRYKPEDFSDMTDPIGFPSMTSLLAAVNSYVKSEKTGALGDLFEEQYLSVNTRYATGGIEKPMETPYRDLEKLQSLLDNNVVVPAAEAFDCVFFSRSREWFLTAELVTSLSLSEVKFARALIHMVTSAVAKWYDDNNGRLFQPYPDSERAFLRLKKILGPFRHALIRTNLFQDKDCVIIRADDDEEEDGWLFEVWAGSCQDFPAIVERALLCVERGSFPPFQPPETAPEFAGCMQR